MALLAGVAYDPATLVNKATSSLLAMTALDTTNLRLSFTVPANGKVLVRLRGLVEGATTFPQVLLGVLESSTVKGRQVPLVSRPSSSATSQMGLESLFLVTGLTPSANLTWDAAYGVETVVASTNLRYGGPNDATVNNAAGAFSFEVWETENLLAGVHYDPSTIVTKAVTNQIALTAFDTTNARLAFTTPASGPGSDKVLVRIRCPGNGGTSWPSVMFGVLESSTVKGRGPVTGGWCNSTIASTSFFNFVSEFLIDVSPSTSYTWDAAYAVERGAASQNLKYGGPNNTTADDAAGGLTFEVWGAN